MDEDLVEVELSKVVLQQKNEQQYIHLRVRGGSRSFPIVIGDHEAFEIRRKLRGKESVRPLTHDLIGRILRALDTRIPRIIISGLRDHTFYAALELTHEGDVQHVDCRPSDAIALSVQFRCPLYVSRDVLDQVAPEEPAA